jgi:hypothetical protein
MGLPPGTAEDGDDWLGCDAPTSQSPLKSAPRANLV